MEKQRRSYNQDIRVQDIRKSGYQKKISRVVRPTRLASRAKRVGLSAGGAGCPPVFVNFDEAGESETNSGYAEGIPVEKYPSRRQHKQDYFCS
jgi:hypothetical protein